MKPATPVIEGQQDLEIVMRSEGCVDLPVVRLRREHGWCALSRWRLSIRERLQVLFTGDIYVEVMTASGMVPPYQLRTWVEKMARVKVPEPSKIVAASDSRRDEYEARQARRLARSVRGEEVEH